KRGIMRTGMDSIRFRRYTLKGNGLWFWRSAAVSISPAKFWGNRALPWSGVAAAGADQTVVFVLFDDVGGPAGDTRHNEDGRVEGVFQAERVVKASGGPVEVGVQVLFVRHHPFDDFGSFFFLAESSRRCQLPGHRLEDAGPYVSGFVDAVAETHHAAFAG